MGTARTKRERSFDTTANYFRKTASVKSKLVPKMAAKGSTEAPELIKLLKGHGAKE